MVAARLRRAAAAAPRAEFCNFAYSGFHFIEASVMKQATENSESDTSDAPQPPRAKGHRDPCAGPLMMHTNR